MTRSTSLIASAAAAIAGAFGKQPAQAKNTPISIEDLINALLVKAPEQFGDAAVRTIGGGIRFKRERDLRSAHLVEALKKEAKWKRERKNAKRLSDGALRVVGHAYVVFDGVTIGTGRFVLGG